MSWDFLLVIWPGILLGILVGVLRGLSPQNALIMLLPLVLAVPVEQALAFMVALYCAATTLDGYSMRASVFGGLISTLATLALLPWISEIGLYLRSVEMVVVMLLGLTLIAVLAARDTLKALIAGLLGLLIGVIGTDPIYNAPRATFGFLELYDGVPVVPALIGLFAISEALVMIGDNLRMSLQKWWHTSGTLLPMVALGVPGGSTAAVIMIVLQYHGMLMGPRLFTTNPEVAYGVFVSMALAYIFLLFTIVLLARYRARVVLIPTTCLAPVIILLTIVAAFGERQYLFDMALALVFGVIGYIAHQTRYHVTAILIGILLGPLFEQYLVRALLISEGDLAILFSSTLGNVLWALLALSLVFRRALRKSS